MKSNQFIGDCGITMQNIHGDGNLFPEIGYHIDKRFWCRGYASQAAKACLSYVLRTLFLMRFSCIKRGQIFHQEKWLRKWACHCMRNMLTRKI
jgi:hypothetical protein